MKRSIAILSALLLLLATAGGASAAPASPTPAPSAPPPGTPAQPSAPPENYVLGVGDQIDVNVFGEPDLTRSVTIKPDGIITLPLINQVKAGGKTIPQLEAELTKMYARYLRSPSVSVSVRQFRMPRVYVMGEVSKPGRYDLLEDMSVLDALTAAGGATDKGNLDGLQLARVENGKSKAIPIKMDQVVQGKDAKQNLKLQNGDLVYVPRRGMTLLEILQSIGALKVVLGLF